MNKQQKITKGLIEEFRGWTSLGLSPDTASSYACTLKVYCLGKTIAEVNRKEFFIKFGEDLKKRGMTLGTVSRHTFGIKKFLNFLYEKYDLPIINLNMVRCRKSPKHNPTYLEKQEIEAIRRVPVRTVMELRDRALFEFLLDTGCRISEALGIDRTRIDFERGEVEVLGKGNKRRTVFVNDSKEWLLEYLDRRGSDAAPLFLTQYKTRRLDRGNAATAIREFGKKAGLAKKVHPHLMRHTFGTYLIWAGVDVRTVQELMGHDDLETTLKYYSAVTQERMKEAHARFGEFMGKGRPAMRSAPGVAYPAYK